MQSRVVGSLFTGPHIFCKKDHENVMFHQIARTREDRYVLALYTRRAVGVTSGVRAEQASTFATRHNRRR